MLLLKASGHTFHTEINTQPFDWNNLEVRVDERCENRADLSRLGFHVGDTAAVDPNLEIHDNGYVNSRHLDDKAGCAVLFGAAKAVLDSGAHLPVDCHLLFTISEEVGSGASAVLHGDVPEMVTIDNGTIASGQNSAEFGATVAMADSTGPFDCHLTHHLIDPCRKFEISYERDIFCYYRSDSASAVEAGNDLWAAQGLPHPTRLNAPAAPSAPLGCGVYRQSTPSHRFFPRN